MNALERGSMSCVRAVIVLAVVAYAHYAASEHVGVCLLPFCACYPSTHPSWTTVNCSVPPDKRLDILDGDLPDTTTDLLVSGAETVLIGTSALSRLKDARYVRITGAKLILMRKFAAVNLNVVSLLLEIDGCDVLRIEQKTFTNIKGPLSISIKNCITVSVDGEAFSWLLSASIWHVNQLQLGPGAFMLDPSAANVGEHGPGLIIELKNVTVPEMTSQTFGSSAARITLDRVDVQDVRAEAFAANTYNEVLALNCSFHHIHGQAFAQKTLINTLKFCGSTVHQLASGALQSAVATLNITHSKFKNIETGAINITVVSVIIKDNTFNNVQEKGLELSSWNKFQMERNSFDELAVNAFVAPGATIHELIFSDNEIETMHDNSLGFIGQAQASSANAVVYNNNYYGHNCYCNITPWIGKVLGAESGEPFKSQSYCTVDELFARCFNVPEQNMLMKRFVENVCNDDVTLQCEPFKTKTESGDPTEIKNPRFPHKKEKEGLSDRNKKVIGIVIVTTLGCALIALLFSLVRWMRRKGYCLDVKNYLVSSNTSCASLCDRLCFCNSNSGLDNAGSISQMSVNEYSERHRLNEPGVHEMIQETTIPEMYNEIVATEDKTTQTLPEELTKELLESLKEKLDDPENYVEAREMIEHLYDLIKVEENCNNMSPSSMVEENIYELPFQNTVPRLGKNKKQMISIGTKTPSLEELLPLSPYNRQTSLAHEYFEPKDFAVHLYAEITNSNRERKPMMSAMPDIVAEQVVPRGPYLRAVRDKSSSSATTSPSGKSMTISMFSSSPSPHHTSTITSNKSVSSNSSNKMMNRPLPEKPTTPDLGEGTSSSKQG